MGYDVRIDGSFVCSCSDSKTAEFLNENIERLYESFQKNSDISVSAAELCKYVSALYLTKRYFAVNNYNYKKPSKINVEGIMLHSPAAPRPDALQEIKRDFNKYKDAKETACTHAVIDGNNGRIFQILPWNWRAYHCAGSFNSSHIAVDMCDPGEIKYTKNNGRTGIVFNEPADKSYEKARAVVDRTFDSAVKLCVALCIMFNLNPLGKGKGADGKEYPNVILSHREAYVNFKSASNHGDPETLWNAFGSDRNYNMDSFREAVANGINEYKKSGYFIPIHMIGR